MSGQQPELQNADQLGAYAGGKVFERVFTEGMALIEETASYLDGPGRTLAEKLPRESKLTYTSWSMELTTRLMQAASWLVMQKAVKDGDMRREEAFASRYRLTRDSSPLNADAQTGNGLPDRFLELVASAEALFERIVRLDAALYSGKPRRHRNSISHQIEVLQKAAQTGAFDPLAIWGKTK